MKTLALSLLLTLITGCSTRPAARVVFRSAPPTSDPAEHLRYGEVVRAYHVGRYVDPTHSSLMHEGHPLYRIEASPRWNLRNSNGGATTLGLLNPPRDAAYSQPQTNDVILAELSRQRDATERVMWEAFQLAGMYDQIKKAMADMSEVAKNHVWMRTRLSNAEQRVNEVSSELEKVSKALDPTPGRSPSPSNPTNVGPSH